MYARRGSRLKSHELTGRVELRRELDAHDARVTQREDHRELPGDDDPAAQARPTLATDRDHLVAGSSDLSHLGVHVTHGLEPSEPELAAPAVAAVHAEARDAEVGGIHHDPAVEHFEHRSHLT